jgi:hypothetical protein
MLARHGKTVHGLILRLAPFTAQAFFIKYLSMLIISYLAATVEAVGEFSFECQKVEKLKNVQSYRVTRMQIQPA